jgi:exodeoxyribonuclease VII small subunit
MTERKTFSQKLQRLEEIVSSLERPDVELEEGLALLEEGVSLHKECQQMLTKTQAKITTLLNAQSSGVDMGANEPPSDEPAEDVIEIGLFGNAEASTSDPVDDEGLPF